jgi:hypothetical protein
MLRPPLQRVAALRPGRRPAGRCRAPPGPPPDRFRSARTASLPAGPVLSCRPRCQLRDGSRGPPGPHPFPILLHCSDPSWSFGIQFTPPGGLTGGLEFHRSWSFQGFVSAQRADSQRSCADPAPSCWTARLGGVGPQPTGRRVTTDVPRSQ